MTTYTRRTRCRPLLAAEPGGAWDASPLAEMAAAVEALEAAKRRTLAAFRDVAAWSGTAQTTGLTQSEWLTLAGRLSSRDAHRLERMTSRLSALPVTASLLAAGKLTFDQAAQICDGTTRLSGSKLAEVDRIAAHAAAVRNERGDAPDIDVDVDRLVQERRKPRDVEAAERRAIAGSRVFGQQDLDGGGRVSADLDATAFPTVWGAIEHAAGTPSPDVSRSNQRAEGLLAIGDSWMAGTTGASVGVAPRGAGVPDVDASLTDVTHADADVADDADAVDGTGETSERDVTSGTAAGHHADIDARRDATTGEAAPRIETGRRAKPSITLTIDIADATPATFAQVWRTAAGRHAPHLSARMTDVIACTADLKVLLTAGAQPLIELKDQATLPAPVRRAVLHRDRGCRWPTCTAPVHHCDVHHITHRADGGDHHVNNLMTLCRRHHTRLHGPHWTVRLDPETAAISFSRRRDGTRPAHTTFPHGTHPTRSGAPPGVATLR